MDEHGPTGSVVSALVALRSKEAAEAAEPGEPRPEVPLPEARPEAEAAGRLARWKGLAAMGMGLTVAVVCLGMLGSQLWHVKQQLDRQRRIRKLVTEAGLPPHFVPKIETSNRWAIGSSLGVVFGLFWVVWGAVRYRDAKHARRLAGAQDAEELDPGDADAAPADAAPADAGSDGRHRRPARRRSGHRHRR